MNTGRGALAVRPSRLVALDFETAVPYDHVLEVGCVEICNGALTNHVFHALVKPTVRISPFAAAIHGITDQSVMHAPHFADIVDLFIAFIGDARIIAHASYVERTILERELARHGRPAIKSDRFICTLQMARQSLRFARNGLRDVCEALGISLNGARFGYHDALHDARMAAEIYLRLQSTMLH